MSEQEARQIEMSMEQARAFIDAGKAVQRLQQNPDFQLIFTQGYLKNEAIRLVHLKSDHEMQTPERQRAVDNDILAIGSLAHYLNMILQHAQMSVDAMEDNEQALDEIRAEDAESGQANAASTH